MINALTINIIPLRLGLLRSSGSYRAQNPRSMNDWIEYSISFDDQGRDHTYEMVEQLSFRTNNALNVSVHVKVDDGADMEIKEIANILGVSGKVLFFLILRISI